MFEVGKDSNVQLGIIILIRYFIVAREIEVDVVCVFFFFLACLFYLCLYDALKRTLKSFKDGNQFVIRSEFLSNYAEVNQIYF